jgi:hypothetical protein
MCESSTLALSSPLGPHRFVPNSYLQHRARIPLHQAKLTDYDGLELLGWYSV